VPRLIFLAAARGAGAGALLLCIYTAIILCSVCGLWAYHAWLIAANLTTNEAIKGTYDARDGGARQNPHDRGALRNCAAFLCAPTPPSRVAEYLGSGGDVDGPAGPAPNALFDVV
jgi:hypothetical protein